MRRPRSNPRERISRIFERVRKLETRLTAKLHRMPVEERPATADLPSVGRGNGDGHFPGSVAPLCPPCARGARAGGWRRGRADRRSQSRGVSSG